MVQDSCIETIGSRAFYFLPASLCTIIGFAWLCSLSVLFSELVCTHVTLRLCAVCRSDLDYETGSDGSLKNATQEMWAVLGKFAAV